MKWINKDKGSPTLSGRYFIKDAEGAGGCLYYNDETKEWSWQQGAGIVGEKYLFEWLDETPSPVPADLQQEAEALYPMWPFGKHSKQRLMAEDNQAAYIAGRSKSIDDFKSACENMAKLQISNGEEIVRLEQENARLKDEIDFLFKYLPEETKKIILEYKPEPPKQ